MGASRELGFLLFLFFFFNDEPQLQFRPYFLSNHITTAGLLKIDLDHAHLLIKVFPFFH